MLWRALLALLAAGAAHPSFGDEYPSMAELARARDAHIGGNFSMLMYNDANPSERAWSEDPATEIDRQLAKRHFTIMSAGWQMYPGFSWRGDGQFEWRGADVFVDWCHRNGIAVHGHGLAYVRRNKWYTQMPADTEADKAALRRLNEQQVRESALRFAGRVAVWDVCNEMFDFYYNMQWDRPWVEEPDAESDFLAYQNFWKAYQAYPENPDSGELYYRRSFEAARQADPAAELMLLEMNNEVVCPKSDAIYRWTRRWRREGVPINSVGFQMHIDLDLKKQDAFTPDGDGHVYPDLPSYADSMRENFARFGQLGLGLWITEMTVAMSPERQQADLQAALQRQAEIYAAVMRVCLEQPQFRGLKVWGVRDVGPAEKSKSLLFDAAGKPKPAFFAVCRELRDYFPRSRLLSEASLHLDHAEPSKSVELPGLEDARHAYLSYEWKAENIQGDARLLLEVSAGGKEWRTIRSWSAEQIAYNNAVGLEYHPGRVTLPLEEDVPRMARFRLDAVTAAGRFEVADLCLVSSP